MSKQNIGKGNPAARPSNQANKSGADVPTPPKTGGPQARTGSTASNQPVRRAATANRYAQAPVKRKSGFRLRPLDIALLLVGVLVIGFIVMSALQAPVLKIDSNALDVPEGATHVPVGNVAPDFNLPAADGTTYSLSAQKGKVVVLEFLATWCPHCRDDAPMLNQLDAAYKDKGVQIFGINATPTDRDRKNAATIDDLKWFRETYGVTFPLLFDKQLKSAVDYSVTGYPTVYIVGKDGKIAYDPPLDKLPTYQDLSTALDQILK